jgi:hypothetical protein
MMNKRAFQISVASIALAFTALFGALVVPALIDDPDIVGAFAAGFVNPYSSGYSSDVIACWLILAVWIVYEWNIVPMKVGLVSLALGVIPGVAVGFAAYLLLRSRSMDEVEGA